MNRVLEAFHEGLQMLDPLFECPDPPVGIG
jgi:hypothetical protein